MVEALRRLRLEIDALLSALRAGDGAYVTLPSIVARIEDLFLSWSNLRTQLGHAGLPAEVINRVDHLFTELVRLTVSRNPTRKYRQVLNEVRLALTRQVLLEVAKLAEISRPVRALPEDALIPEISDLRTELIPNALLGWKDNMRQFLKETSFDRNVFIMVAYRKRLDKLIGKVRDELVKLELNGVIAREHRLTEDLYNPLACLLCCKYGVAIFDRGETGQRHNPNIVYELAVMQILKRPCVILKHKSLGRNMPSDFLHRLYEEYGTNGEAVEKLRSWWSTKLT